MIKKLATVAGMAALVTLAGCSSGPKTLDFKVGARGLPSEGRRFCIMNQMDETFDEIRVEIHASLGLSGQDRLGNVYMNYENVEPDLMHCKPFSETWGGTELGNYDQISKACVFVPYSDEYEESCATF